MEPGELLFPEGYRTLYQYLQSLWDANRDEGLGAMLSGMSLLPDSTPADPAYAGSWNRAVAQARQQTPADDIGLPRRTAVLFLEAYQAYLTAFSPFAGSVALDLAERKAPKLWTKAAEQVQLHRDDPFLQFVHPL